MIIYRSIGEVQLESSAVAIGVFDGVHRGHQQVLRKAAEAAKELGGQSLALTFDRHPAELIAPRYAPLYISCLDQRIEMIEHYCPVDCILVTPFDLSFADLSASEFVSRVLVDRLHARRIFVGADFRYGKDRLGGVMDLEAAGETHGFDVNVIHSVSDLGERVSSTRVRALIDAGEIGRAERLLGHPFAMRGTVIAGKRLGRVLGYPTANVRPEQSRQLLPAAGVYAARAIVHADSRRRKLWRAAVSVGVNPTTDFDDGRYKVEAYIMDGFDEDIYGSTIEIEFVKRLRGEEKFESLAALVVQIRIDVEQVESVLR